MGCAAVHASGLGFSSEVLLVYLRSLGRRGDWVLLFGIGSRRPKGFHRRPFIPLCISFLFLLGHGVRRPVTFQRPPPTAVGLDFDCQRQHGWVHRNAALAPPLDSMPRRYLAI